MKSEATSIFATIAGALATCSMFAFQRYEYNKRLEYQEQCNDRILINRILESLLNERTSVTIEYPSIDEHWQIENPCKRAIGIESFLRMHTMACSLLVSLDNENWQDYQEKYAECCYNDIVEERNKWINCPDSKEYEAVEIEYDSTKKLLELGMYNSYVGLNKEVHRLNQNKTEHEKRELCAYYVLKTYEHSLSKYLKLSSTLANEVFEYKMKYNDKKEIKHIQTYIQSNLSEAERDLIKNFLVLKKPTLLHLLTQ